MSLKYIDHNGASHDIAGISPGGNIEYGAVATRTGNADFPAITGQSGSIEITFSEPMPDDDYLVELEAVSGYPLTSGSITIIPLFANSKTANGFNLLIYNNTGSTIPEGLTIKYTAYKLYDVADAEELYSTVQDMEKAFPSDASSSNKLATIRDVTSETRSLDRRLDDVEDVIPNDATITNKLATAEDVAEAMANAGLKVTDTIPTSPEDGDVLLYIGTEEGFTKGGIYQYSATQGEWILISTADVDLSNYETSWTGTKAEWDALTTAEKKEYKIANITDDVIGGEVADVVANGDTRPVTSNAVFQNSPIKIKEYVFAATTTTTEIQITETEAQDPFIVYGFVHSTNYSYNVSLPWNTEVTAFINRGSQILSLTITTSNYYGQAHVFVGHYE